MQDNYQSQTGQVAPIAQNPQNSVGQPYDQSGVADFQNSSDSLLEGQSSSNLLLPDGQTSITPSGTIEISASTYPVQTSKNYNSIFLIIIIATTMIMFYVLLKYISRNEESVTPSDSPDEENVKLPTEISVDESEDMQKTSDKEVLIDNSTKVSKKQTKKTNKKSKKRKKR